MHDEYKPDFPSEVIKEGKVAVLVPKLIAFGVCPSDYAPSKAPVFYNPVMEFNRDLTVLAFQTYQRLASKEIVICEPHTGTGIRSIRFATEIEGVKHVVSGDINSHSIQLATYNTAINNLQTRIRLKHQDANRLLSNYSPPKKRFDIIDIDPFGTPVPFLDSAVQALRNNGLLAVTATDMAPLCGVHPRACVRKYGGKPLRTEYCKELAVRFLAGCIATTAAKHDIGTHFLFSHCDAHYIRTYIQIGYGAQRADEAIKNIGYVLHCFKCLHRETAYKPFPETAAKCPECGAKMDYAGPLWMGKILNAEFIERMTSENTRMAFRESGRIGKLLTQVKAEANMPATYFVLDKLSGKLRLPAPSTADFFAALHNAGFKAAATHFNPRGVRTDAPASIMQDILRKLTSSSR
jgi:tRNA (guanine26-N2/guanine27-N2)-dimethyltransferase